MRLWRETLRAHGGDDGPSQFYLRWCEAHAGRAAGRRLGRRRPDGPKVAGAVGERPAPRTDVGSHRARPRHSWLARQRGGVPELGGANRLHSGPGGDASSRRTPVAPGSPRDASLPGDAVRLGPLSRAAIALRDGGVLRLDQNTTITFTPPAVSVSTWVELLTGAVHFFSRTPRGLRITTPFVNGTVEGTEFLVEVDPVEARITVWEGRVLAENAQGSLALASGQSAAARAGQPPMLRPIVVSPPTPWPGLSTTPRSSTFGRPTSLTDPARPGRRCSADPSRKPAAEISPLRWPALRASRRPSPSPGCSHIAPRCCLQ